MVIVHGGYTIYRRFGWRFFHRECDFSGQWQYSITLNEIPAEHTERENSEWYRERRAENEWSGSFRILQTADRLSVVVPRDGPEFASERSSVTTSFRCIDMDDDGNRIVLMFEQRVGQRQYAGIDDMSITARDKQGRPNKMQGPYPLWEVGESLMLMKGYIHYRKLMPATRNQIDSGVDSQSTNPNLA